MAVNITNFLSPADVILDQPAADKAHLLKELARRAAATLHLKPSKVAEAVLKREKLGSTGVGGGVAIPHARLTELEKPFGLLARLKTPIDFDAIDGGRVDLVFLLLAPAAPDGEQLSALACVARVLRDPAVAEGLRRANDGAALFRTVAEARQGPA